MWHSVGFLLFLLFFSSPGHDVKKFQFVKDDLYNTSAQYYGQVSSCYRKVNPDKCNSLTVRSEIQKFRQILPTDSNRASSGGLLSPSISCSGSNVFSSSVNLDSHKLVPSVNALPSAEESPPIFSGKLPFKRHNWPFSLPLVHTPRRYLFAAPSLPVEPSMNRHSPNHIFPRLALDHMPPSGTPKISSPVFVPRFFSKSHTSHMSPPAMHNIPPFVSPVRSSPQEPTDIGAPHSFIPPNSHTTGKMRLVQVPSFLYDSVSSGPSLSPQQNSQSHETKHPRRDVHALPPSSVPAHHGQPQDQSPSGSFENRPFARILPPSSGLPSIIHSPSISVGKQAQGPYVNKIEPPKSAPSLLLSSWPSTLEPPLVSSQNNQHQRHQTAFHPVMSNSANPSTKWLSPSFIDVPSQVRPPVVHSWTSVTPSGLAYFPPSTSPSEQTVGNISMPVKAPSIRFHSGSHNQGPVASAPSIFTLGKPQNEPSMPVTAVPRNSLNRQAPVAMPPMYFSSPSKSPVEKPKAPEVAPFANFSHPLYRHDAIEPAVSPIVFPSEPPWKRSTIPVTAPVQERSPRHAPASGSFSSPKISLPLEPPLGNVESPAFVPSLKSAGNPPPTILPSEPREAPPPIISPSHGHHQNVQCPVTSPGIFPFKPPMKNSSVPHIDLPRNRSKRQPPVTLGPKNQDHVTAPMSIPSEPHTEYPVTQKMAPSITFHFPPYQRGLQGPIISPSNPHQKKPRMPVGNQPGKRSRRHAPMTSVSVTQGPVSFPPIAPPPVQPIGNSRTTFAPSITIPSPSHYSGVKGHVTSPRSDHYGPPPKKSSIVLAPSPMTRSHWHVPTVIPPIHQGPFYSRSTALPPELHTANAGPTASPLIIASQPPQKMQRAIRASPPTKRPWRHAPLTIQPVHQGSVPSQFTAPSGTPKVNSRAPAFAPRTMFPTPHHHWVVKGPINSPPSMIPSQAPQRKPSMIPSQAPQRKPSMIPSQAPQRNPSMIPSQAPQRNPSMIPSQAPQRKSSTPVAAPPNKRSWKIAPVASLPIVQGPVSSPVKSQNRNLRNPTVSPSIIVPFPPHHRSRKHAPVGSPPMIQGPIHSPVKSPHLPSSGNLRTPTISPSIIFPSPPHNQSRKHAPVASPAMIQGPVYAPVKSLHPQSSGNLRTPTVSPSVIFPSSPHNLSQKHAPVASPAMIEGPAYAPVKSLHPPSSGNWRTPTVSPTQKHAPVGSQPMIQGPVYSPEKSPHPLSSGNLRTPTVSPSVTFPSPPHDRSWKHVPVASPRMSKGPVYFPVKSPHPSPSGNLRIPAASPSNMFPLPYHHGHGKGPLASPNISPSEPPEKTPTQPVAAPPMIFPPPPPGQDCSSISCTVPLTSPPPGSPCGCVYPMQIELGLGVALYAFFPLVSELASEIAAGTFLKQSQVRIMGANAYSQDQEKTIVDIDLVPLGEKFDNTTAFLIFERFWQKKVMINETLFGDYWVIYIQYHGLPPSPPSAFSNASYNGVPDSSSYGPSKGNPLGVDVNKQNNKMGAGTIAVVALSSAIAVIICLGSVWIILLKCRNKNRPTSAVVEPTLVSSITKRSATGGGSILSGSMASSTSMSFASSMATYTGSAKTFTSAELEKATDRFNIQNILGEGGFGRVYRGVLEDGTKVAVKVLTRDDQQGGREFIAEVEMLSRLHHRNLVKLIGICTEEHKRCLVYELISNGSVESHLHGVDKETAPLDWDARIKIALGAARGLAYLHEDSSPRVIHRDFKASNILLEDDFTPKVSDFGLAKSASEEVSGHISTRVMGTFGYVAPEYAMTGHLLVKSDVYSYGVVLLELLSGRKPVDMSQPPGQENLVTWARPLLTSKEGLETLVDPALGGNFPFDNIARVAAIASMCVQPDHSHRPFMGEVVQALKLVYNDSDASNAGGSCSFSRGESSAHDTEVKDSSSQPWRHSMQYVPDSTSFVTIDYDSGPLETQGLEVERPLSASALMSTSGRFIRQLSGSFRRHSSSGPLRTNKTKKSWYGIRGLAGGSISEHGVKRYFGRGSDGDVHELWP